jgi:hypothetical protein
MNQMSVDNTAFNILEGATSNAQQDLLQYLWGEYGKHIAATITNKQGGRATRTPTVPEVLQVVSARSFLTWAEEHLQKTPPISFQMSNGVAILKLTDGTTVSVGGPLTAKITDMPLPLT